MTTIRVDKAQKAKLEEASRVLAAARGRRVTQGEAVALLADFALRNRDALAEPSEASIPDLRKDPFYDPALVFDIGPTDARTLDRLLYGKRS